MIMALGLCRRMPCSSEMLPEVFRVKHQDVCNLQTVQQKSCRQRERPRMHMGPSADSWRMWVKGLPKFMVRFLHFSVSSKISKIKSWGRSVAVSSWWWGKGLTTNGHTELSGVREVLSILFVVVVM